MDVLHPSDPAWLIARLARDHTIEDAEQAAQLYDVAERAHAGVVRMSGRPYVTHPLAVAELVAQWRLPATCVHAALVHDLPDTGRSLAEFRSQVPGDVLSVVANLQRIDALVPVPDLLADAGDDRQRELVGFAVLVKIADRLHNARTWQYVPQAKARRRAEESIAVIAPIAYREGLAEAGAELISLSLRTLAGSRTERTSVAALDRAVGLLPPAVRGRYAAEWAGDWVHLRGRRERIGFSLGLLWSAAWIRTSWGNGSVVPCSGCGGFHDHERGVGPCG